MTARSRERIAIARNDQLFSTLRTLVRVVGFVFAAYYLRQALEALAGSTTKLELSVLADLKLVLSLALAGAAAAWGAVERTLRYRKTEQLQGRIRELEMLIDPNRTTSGLTSKGQTNPKDKRR